jgi:uncharacterized protein (DUF2267 family)
VSQARAGERSFLATAGPAIAIIAPRIKRRLSILTWISDLARVPSHSFFPFARRERTMSTTGLEIFDRTIQETNGWLKSLMEHLRTDNRHTAYVVLRAALHALRDHVGPSVAQGLGEQLPMLMRGFYYENWRFEANHRLVADKHELAERIRAEMPAGTRVTPTHAAKAVFEVMWEKVAPDEVAKLIRHCSPDIQELWPRVAIEP